MEQDVKISDIKRLMLRTYRKYAAGEISETQAYRENVMLANILKAIEAAETAQKLETIQRAIQRAKTA